jgi:hypothetical protein
MKMSDSIAELAQALAKAQGQIDAASKGAVNPHFKSRYADLNALREAIREPLAVNDLSVVQFPRLSDREVEVETMVMHKSGEFVSETLRMPVGQMTAQAVGSALTYCRRYSLSAILNLAAEDDDGNAASQAAPVQTPAKKAMPKADLTNLVNAAAAEAVKGTPALTTWWKSLAKDQRDQFTSEAIADLKKMAQDADKETTNEDV